VAPSDRLTLPELIDDSLLSEKVGETNRQPENTTSNLASFIETVKLYEVLVEVLSPGYRGVNSSQDIATALSTVLRLHSRLSAWRNALPQQLTFDSSASDISTTDNTSAPGLDYRYSALPMHAKKLMLRYVTRQAFGISD